jgi:hypothetical protein
LVQHVCVYVQIYKQGEKLLSSTHTLLLVSSSPPHLSSHYLCGTIQLHILLHDKHQY